MSLFTCKNASYRCSNSDKARQIKQRMDEKKMADEKMESESKEQSNYVREDNRRDMTASEIRAVKRAQHLSMPATVVELGFEPGCPRQGSRKPTDTTDI